jgi:tungstate transport system substrate-binding protein
MLLAAQPRTAQTALRLGVERAPADTGFVRRLPRAFAAETGLALDPVAGPCGALLDSLQHGEIDAALTQAADREQVLHDAGLPHDCRAVAASDSVIIGPSDRGRDPAAVAGLRDAGDAFAKIARSGAGFLSLADGSGTHLAEQGLWRAAAVAPTPPWYRPIDLKDGALVAQARAQAAYTLIDLASWLAGAPASRAAALHALIEGDPRLATDFHVQRSFRVNPPAGKLFVQWIAGPQGRRVVARTPGLRPPRA